MGTPSVIRPYAALPLVLSLVLPACTAGTSGPSTQSITAPSGSPRNTVTVTASPSETASSAAPSASAAASSAAPAASGCIALTYDALTPEQRLGQLVMVSLSTGQSADSIGLTISKRKVGNIFYLGGWNGADAVKRASEDVQSRANKDSTGNIGFLIAADQEGGEVHQLRGVGFTRPPSAQQQAAMAPAALAQAARSWARELKNAGVNVNFAPVTDTVPAEIGRGNSPIGKWGRQYGSTPERVSRAATAFLKGMLEGGVQPTVKHFPGLGRIRENTDFSATGITDTVTTRNDPYLQPFRDGIAAGAGLVMVGSARYTKIDPDHAAMFSPIIINDVLRGDLGYNGVVITDDINAAAARTLPPGERGVRFIGAGGDIMLTGDPSIAPAMIDAVAAKAEADPAYAAKVAASVHRVLTLKDRMGLLPCSGD